MDLRKSDLLVTVGLWKDENDTASSMEVTRMSDQKTTQVKPEAELLDVLLDFIIVSANLAKKISRALRVKNIMEGGIDDVKNERIAGRCGGAPGSGSIHQRYGGFPG